MKPSIVTPNPTDRPEAPKASYLGTLKRYAQFSGRASRAEIGQFVLVNFVIFSVLSVIPHLVVLLILFMLGMLLPSLAVSCRRLHDMNCSGGWLVVLVFPASFILLLPVLLVVPGTDGRNRFDELPTGPMYAAADNEASGLKGAIRRHPFAFAFLISRIFR